MIDRLPYELSKGVTATREGLHFESGLMPVVGFFPTGEETLWGITVPWPDAAERLNYQEGEPWCTSSDGGFTRDIVCREAEYRPSGITGYIFGEPIRDNALHRLATILCNGAEAFRVLHWCVHNLPEVRNNND